MTTYAQSYAERLATGAFEKLLDEAPHTQNLATLNTFFGRPDLNVGLDGLPGPSAECPTGNAKQHDGAEWVLANTAEARVVMFNENHYGVQARAFVRQIIGDLRSAGFTHIGFETLKALPENGGSYTPATGTYTVEPVFAALLRDAAALGYEIFAYEAETDAPEDATMVERIRVREKGQAANLERMIGAVSSDARFVIFAGWSHIAEEPIPGLEGSVTWMAARLKQKTGIDPFTIDLTSCVYPVAGPASWGGRIYLSEDGLPLVSGRYADAVDAQVHLPVPAEKHREAVGFYRSSLGEPVEVPAALRPEDAPVLVQAYRTDQQPGEVAFDRILLRAGEKLPLYLPAGSYLLKAHGGDGTVVGRASIQVD